MTDLWRAGLAAAALACTLGGCEGPPRSRPTAAASAACRAETDRVYAAQNRVDLSTRDTRDTPFSQNYLPGITSRGLGASFGRANLEQSCLNNAAGGTANGAGATGPAGTIGPSMTPGTGTGATSAAP